MKTQRKESRISTRFTRSIGSTCVCSGLPIDVLCNGVSITIDTLDSLSSLGTMSHEDAVAVQKP